MPLLETASRCEQCGKSSQQLGVSIKECSKCRIVGYCSVDCQKTGWRASHKFECRSLEQIEGVSQRAVSRLRFGKGSDLESRVYYLRVSRPWIHDIFISGPFCTIEDTFSNIARNLRFSQSGMLYFDDLCQQGLMDQVAHIRAPLDADQNKVILIEIIPKNDSELKARLPCSVYNVVWSEPVEGLNDRMGVAQLNSMELVGTFLSADDANAAVRSEVGSQASQFPGARPITMETEGVFHGAIAQGGNIKRAIQVLYDSGETDDTQTYVSRQMIQAAREGDVGGAGL
jgi:hypothetical protein